MKAGGRPRTFLRCRCWGQAMGSVVLWLCLLSPVASVVLKPPLCPSPWVIWWHSFFPQRAEGTAGSSFLGKPCEAKVDRIFWKEALQPVILLSDLGQQIPSHLLPLWALPGPVAFLLDYPQSRQYDVSSQNLQIKAFHPPLVPLHPTLHSL